MISGKTKKRKLFQEILGTIICLLVYRLLCCVPLPFTDTEMFFSGSNLGESFGILNIMTGGAMSRVSIAGMGIAPYITASIFIQIFGIVIPSIAELQRSGAVGRKKIRKLTIGLSVFTGLFSSFGILNMYMSYGVFVRTDWIAIVICMVLMTLCSVMFAFMGDYIEEELFGNGISLFLLAGILSNLPAELASLWSRATTKYETPYDLWLFIGVVGAVCVGMLIFVCWLNETERSVQLEYSGKAGTDSTLVAENSILPLKMLPNSVLPVIFASSFLSVFSVIGLMINPDANWVHWFDMNQWLDTTNLMPSIGLLIYFVMIFVFGYYTQLINMNPIEMASNLKRSGAVIIGVAPGVETEKYLKKYAGRMNFIGCICLCIIAVVPIILSKVFGVPSLSFLGTSLIIIVSVVNETWYTWKVESRSARYVGYLDEMNEHKHQMRRYNSFSLFTKVRP